MDLRLQNQEVILAKVNTEERLYDKQIKEKSWRKGKKPQKQRLRESHWLRAAQTHTIAHRY